MKIAWIGTGVMGRPMALNLRKSGYNVHVYNRTAKKAFDMEKEGVIAHETIASCVKDADFVFTIVGYPKDVLDVYQVVFKHAKKGAVLIDMTTSSPTLAVNLYHRGRELGFSLLDAPVTGSDVAAINAALSIMVGGDEDAFNKALPFATHRSAWYRFACAPETVPRPCRRWRAASAAVPQRWCPAPAIS